MSVNNFTSENFRRRLKRLGYRETEIAPLFNRTSRAVNFYVHGKRRIPPKVWLKLGELEKLPKEELCRRVVAKQSKRKKAVVV